jgi:hypothetical protein
VLEHLPCGVGKSLDTLTAFLNRKGFYEIIKAGMRVTAFEQGDEVVA